jgi:hypothetical protein
MLGKRPSQDRRNQPLPPAPKHYQTSPRPVQHPAHPPNLRGTHAAPCPPPPPPRCHSHPPQQHQQPPLAGPFHPFHPPPPPTSTSTPSRPNPSTAPVPVPHPTTTTTSSTTHRHPPPNNPHPTKAPTRSSPAAPQPRSRPTPAPALYPTPPPGHPSYGGGASAACRPRRRYAAVSQATGSGEWAPEWLRSLAELTEVASISFIYQYLLSFLPFVRSSTIMV